MPIATARQDSHARAEWTHPPELRLPNRPSEPGDDTCRLTPRLGIRTGTAELNHAEVPLAQPDGTARPDAACHVLALSRSRARPGNALPARHLPPVPRLVSYLCLGTRCNQLKPRHQRYRSPSCFQNRFRLGIQEPIPNTSTRDPLSVSRPASRRVDPCFASMLSAALLRTASGSTHLRTAETATLPLNPR